MCTDVNTARENGRTYRDEIGPKRPVLLFIPNTHLAPLALLGGGHALSVAEDLLERRGGPAAYGLLVLEHVEAVPVHPWVREMKAHPTIPVSSKGR